MLGGFQQQWRLMTAAGRQPSGSHCGKQSSAVLARAWEDGRALTGSLVPS